MIVGFKAFQDRALRHHLLDVGQFPGGQSATGITRGGSGSAGKTFSPRVVALFAPGKITCQCPAGGSYIFTGYHLPAFFLDDIPGSNRTHPLPGQRGTGPGNDRRVGVFYNASN